jgi:hypothetical protein
MAALIDLYYDLTCQDLAPKFEDHHKTFFAEDISYIIIASYRLRPSPP